MRRLEPRYVERLWGREDLAPFFGAQRKRIGEVWFQAAPDHPLLLKFLFTSDKLSVQVHPDDALAARLEGCRGKTEMWYVLDAEPDSKVALGLREQCEASALRQALETPAGGEVLQWIDASPGDAFLIPAGAIHAIGAGLVLCEVQQNSDITYRLFDYNRGRELHLDRGLEAANLALSGQRGKLPIRCKYFEAEELRAEADEEITLSSDSFVIVLEGTGQLGDHPLHPGIVVHTEGPTREVLKPYAPMHLLCVTTPPA